MTILANARNPAIAILKRMNLSEAVMQPGGLY
jgi:hypothetical protein